MRLKLQAKSYKKHSWLGEQLSVKLPKPEAIKPTVPQATSIDEAAPESAAIIDEKQISPVKSKSSSKTPLPALLPDEVLAVELVTRLLTPPLSVDKVFTNKKRRFLDTDSKPPKDIKYGRTKVRVLQANRTTLPPKASTIGKALRESWLLGRRGLKGGLAVPRRKPCGGFVRK